MDGPKETHVGLVENDREYRREFMELLENHPSINSVRDWESAETFLRDPEGAKLDLVFLDIGLSGMDGVALAESIATRDADTRIIMLTNMNSDELIFESLKNGAVGYILKSELENLDSVVRTVIAGGGIMTPTIAFRVLRSFKKPESNIKSDLTTREKQILDLIVTGKTIQKVADFLTLSKNTVHSHVKSVYRKLNVHNRMELARKAADAGLL